MPASAARPLKVTPTSTPSKGSDQEHGTLKTPVTSVKRSSISNPPDISSPHELTAFVEKLLDQLDVKFDEMSSQILDRMNQMSTRVDSLEAAIQDIINGDVAVAPPDPTSPQ